MDFLSAPDRPPKLERQKLNVGEFLIALRLRDICRLSDRGEEEEGKYSCSTNQATRRKEGGSFYSIARIYHATRIHGRGEKTFGNPLERTCGKGGR